MHPGGQPEDPRVAQARLVYRDLQHAALAGGPLAGMGEWVRTGAPPPSAALRSAGLTCAGPPDTEAGFRQRHQLALSRPAFLRAFGYSIPCAEAVQALGEGAPLVEIGAGSGYWTALMTAAGHVVAATDLQTSGDSAYGFRPGAHAEVEALDAVAAVRAYPERDVFCSWPSDGESWALGAVRTLRPGRRFAVVLNPGNTGSPGLRRYLATRCRPLRTVVLPQFPGCADELTVYEKLGTCARAAAR